MTESSAPPDYTALEQRLAAWAAAEPRVLALLLIGSRARPLHLDEWSDIDVIALVTDPTPLLGDLRWLHEIGDVWLTHVGEARPGDPELFILFAGALKVDIVFEQIPLADLNITGADFDELLAASTYQTVLQHGWRSLSPPHRGPQTAPASAMAFAPLPDDIVFHNAIAAMLLETTQVAKFLHRGEHWRARRLLDYEMRGQLFQMISWLALARSDPVVPQFDGRRLSKWGSPEQQHHLLATVSRPQTQTIMPAALHMLALFRTLARELATRLDLSYPWQMDEDVSGWLAVHAPDLDSAT